MSDYKDSINTATKQNPFVATSTPPFVSKINYSWDVPLTQDNSKDFIKTLRKTLKENKIILVPSNKYRGTGKTNTMLSFIEFTDMRCKIVVPNLSRARMYTDFLPRQDIVTVNDILEGKTRGVSYMYVLDDIALNDFIRIKKECCAPIRMTGVVNLPNDYIVI